MPTCPHCGNIVPENASYCGNCGAALNAPSPSRFASQSSIITPAFPTGRTRLESALRRAEILTYTVIGLGLAILAYLIIISLLNM